MMEEREKEDDYESTEFINKSFRRISGLKIFPLISGCGKNISQYLTS